MKFSKKDQELIEVAQKVVLANKDLYEGYDMIVGSALRSKSGKIYIGVNIKTSHSICAEQVAIGQAFACGEREFDTIVSVKLNEDYSTRITSPCGVCRYTFDKLQLDINVILEDIKTGEVLIVKTKDLLPYPYKRNVKKRKKC